MGIVKSEDKRASLRRETKRAYEHKDDGSNIGYFNLPSGVSLIKWEKDKKYRCIIIAYKAGEKHPLVKSGDFKEGEYVSSLEFHAHKGLGIDGKKSTLCLKSTFGKKCAVCDYMDELKEKGRVKQAEVFTPKKQVGYIVYDVKEGKNNLSILCAPHFCFEKGLIEAARTAAEEDDSFVDYPYLDGEGAIIKYMVIQSSFKNKEGKTSSFLCIADGTSFKEITKEDELPTKLLNNPFCLDDCLRIPTYEDVQKILFAADEDEEETVTRDEDEKPEADEEQEEKAARSKEQECPHDHKFGKDNDKYEDDCDDCKVWNACKKAKKEKE